MNEAVDALAPSILVQSIRFLIVVQVFTMPFPSVCDLCSFSQIFAVADWIAGVAGTFESLV